MLRSGTCSKVQIALYHCSRFTKEIRPTAALQQFEALTILTRCEPGTARGPEANQTGPAGRSSNQNRVPFFPSDSTPTVPPIRSTALRTIASPTPVPS